MNGVTSLLSCPFCGNSTALECIEISELVNEDLCQDITLFQDKFIIICSATTSGCGGSGPQSSSRSGAAQKWNDFRVDAGSAPRISDYV